MSDVVPVTSATERVVFLSSFHDYRTSKKASIQQVADGLVRRGYDVSFVSTRFSWLSRLKGDSRLFLWDRANRIEICNGVRCYLWRTIAHPFASRHRLVSLAMAAAYRAYAHALDRTIDGLLAQASFVVIESSVAVIFLRRIRRLNPGVRIIYYATDRLDTVGTHPFVRRRLVSDAALIDHVCLRSPRMLSDFGWIRDRLYRAEFGMNPADGNTSAPSPFTAPINAVAVGSMLFDRRFFELAAPLFPHITFHVIGCGETFEAPPNVVIYPEMKFEDTLAYVKHASIGIAPYRPAPGVEYLAESSLKLAQYEFFGLPAVCPQFAVGDNATRSGYEPGDATSIGVAITHALSLLGKVEKRNFLTWDEVADRVLRPREYPGVQI